MGVVLLILGALGEILPVKTVARLAAAVGISDFIKWCWIVATIVLGLTVIIYWLKNKTD